MQCLADLYPSIIGQLCSQCVDWFGSCTDPVLVPKSSFFQAPGGPLKSTLTGFTRGDIKELNIGFVKDVGVKYLTTYAVANLLHIIVFFLDF